MDEIPPPIVPKEAPKLQPREILRMTLIVIIAAGVVVMLMRDVLSDIQYARSGVAVLTAAALVVFYLTGKKKE